MKYIINKIPKHLFEGTFLLSIENKGDKCKLVFSDETERKVLITFNGVFTKVGDPLDKKFKSISLTEEVGICTIFGIQKINGRINDYEQLFISFEEGRELICGVKNLVVEEVVPSNIVFRTRKMVMPADLNGADTLYGAAAFAMIDQEAYVYCACQLNYRKLVTAGVSTMNFTSPAVEGDIIEVGCDVVRFGTSSITVKAVIRNKTTKKDICVVDEITFVSIDENGLPIKHGKTQKIEE